MEKRLEKLEILAMEQEHTIDSLSREVHQQQQSILMLEQHIQILKNRIEAISKEELVATAEEDDAPPPHY